METATRLIDDYGKKGHPLGKCILINEVPKLTFNLRKRLGMQESELDFSPGSLKLLEEKLFKFYQKTKIKKLSDDDIVMFVREISAYVGYVLVIHAEGEWKAIGTLFSTQIVFRGGIKITKGGRTRNVPSVAFYLGNIGAAALDLIALGKKPLLYENYSSAKKKAVKEEFNKT